MYWTNFFINVFISSSALVRNADILSTVSFSQTGGNTENKQEQTKEKCPCCGAFLMSIKLTSILSFVMTLHVSICHSANCVTVSLSIWFL